MSAKEEDDYDKGLVFEKIPEILTRGHVVSAKRVDILEERASHSKYLLLPTKFSFPKIVRIYSMVFSFVSKCMRGRVILSRLLCEGKLWFSMFHANLKDSEEGRDVSCIAMVTSLEGETCPVGLGLVAMFSEELFMSRSRGETFAATQTEATEEVMMTAEEEAMTMGVSIYAKSDVHTCIIHMKV